MIKKTIQDFDLRHIAESGQCFRMNRLNSYDSGIAEYEIVSVDKYLKVTQEGKNFTFYCENDEYENYWHDYFDFDTDYAVIKEMADSKDEFLCRAIEFGTGIRILRQNLWEMIVTFLISQQNNIPRIRKCVENICLKYGEPIKGTDKYSFPTPDKLAVLQDDALMECNLGYRSKYVVRAAKSVVSGEINLDELLQMEYEQSRERLLEIYGIGKKVADCVCLFGLHHVGAFPIDTHIKQILEREYPNGFPLERYDGYAGIIQQYIFYYEING